MREEAVTRRVLGALRFIDVNTRAPLSGPMFVEGPQLKLVRNYTNHYVIFSAAGLEAHRDAFQQPPASPTIGSLTFALRIVPPGGDYLPRRYTLALPRDPDPQHIEQENSLFHPAEVPLFLAPSAKIAPGWAIIRATVLAQGTNTPLPGALIRVLQPGPTETDPPQILARGLTDWRGRVAGEALIGVPGLPVTTWGEGNGGNGDDEPVLVNEIQVSLEAIFDPTGGDWPDPEALEVRRAELPSTTHDVSLASGQTLVTTLTIAL